MTLLAAQNSRSSLNFPQLMRRPVWRRDSATTAAETAALELSVEIEEFLRLLAVIEEGPFFGVMVIVYQGEDHALHVAGVWSCQTGGVNVAESNDFSVGRESGFHSRLVPGSAVVREQEAVGAVEMNHADHIFVGNHDFAENGRAGRRHFEGHLQRLSIRGFALPRAGKCFD